MQKHAFGDESTRNATLPGFAKGIRYRIAYLAIYTSSKPQKHVLSSVSVFVSVQHLAAMTSSNLAQPLQGTLKRKHKLKARSHEQPKQISIKSSEEHKCGPKPDIRI